jgi:hypothetical protein
MGTAARVNLIRFNRDSRVDFFRGLALWWIFMDHIPDNRFAIVSLRNFALCDAAEAFVFLAGYGAGLAYGLAMNRQGWLFAGADALKRAWTLYIAHIFLFVVFSAQVSYSAAALDRADYLDEIHLDVLADAPYRAMFEALILRFQPAYLDILPMYVALLVMFAMIGLPLLRWPAVLAILSLAVYGAARITGANFPSWTGGGWYFNPLTWQALFMLGAIASYRRPWPGRGERLIDIASVAIVLAGIIVQWVVWPYPDTVLDHLPRAAARALVAVDKQGLHPFRFLNILALAWLVARFVPRNAAWLRSRVAAPFVLCGQHSLPVFCSGIFLSFLGRLAMEEEQGWAMQVAVNVVGPLALVGVGALAAWYREKGRQALPASRASGNAGVT